MSITVSKSSVWHERRAYWAVDCNEHGFLNFELTRRKARQLRRAHEFSDHGKQVECPHCKQLVHPSEVRNCPMRRDA